MNNRQTLGVVRRESEYGVRYFRAPGTGTTHKESEAHRYTWAEFSALDLGIGGAKGFKWVADESVDDLKRQIEGYKADISGMAEANKVLADQVEALACRLNITLGAAHQWFDRYNMAALERDVSRDRFESMSSAFDATLLRAQNAETKLKALTRTLGGVARGERIPEGASSFAVAA